MRYLPKIFVVTVCLLAVTVLSSSLYADDMLMGSFTLPHPTQWNKTMLAPGDYTFRVTRTVSNTNLLTIRSAKQAFVSLIYLESACATYCSGSLNVEVHDDNRVVTSLDLMGYHVDVKGHMSAHEREQEVRKAPVNSERVAFRIDPK
jgi:hypothetical protein